MTSQFTKQNARRNARRQLWDRWDEYAERVASWDGSPGKPQISALCLSGDTAKPVLGKKIAGNERLLELAGWQ